VRLWRCRLPPGAAVRTPNCRPLGAECSLRSRHYGADPQAVGATSEVTDAEAELLARTMDEAGRYRAVLERLAHRFRTVPPCSAMPWLRDIREVLK